MVSLTVALVAGTGLALAFESTRWLGVLGAALLGFLFPLLVPIAALVAAGGFLYFKHRRG